MLRSSAWARWSRAPRTARAGAVAPAMPPATQPATASSFDAAQPNNAPAAAPAAARRTAPSQHAWADTVPPRPALPTCSSKRARAPRNAPTGSTGRVARNANRLLKPSRYERHALACAPPFARPPSGARALAARARRTDCAPAQPMHAPDAAPRTAAIAGSAAAYIITTPPRSTCVAPRARPQPPSHMPSPTGPTPAGFAETDPETLCSPARTPRPKQTASP